ncbi:MAG: halo-acid dehalogenase-like hydrolase [Monoraphidium minutum]|nr:MAG: halo-acid dehalogenase-like hydrolase [Monoraphidium minutum]
MRTLNSMQRLRSHPPFNARRTARAARSDIVVARMGRGPVTLVSFDIDGTLIRSAGQDANRLHKEAFSAGFQRVFGIDTHIDVVKHHGGTDPLIAVKVMMHHGIPKSTALERLPELEAAMTDHFTRHQERAGQGLVLLPGVRQLLERLQERPDVATCLVTGNLEPIGWGKMTALGIDHLFTAPRFGGFGSDHCSGDVDEMWRDRAEFVKVAARRCAEALPGVPVAAHWHVGDTPMDVRAALQSGARALGVATGVFPQSELDCLGSPPELVVLPTLEDTDAVMAALGLA